MKRISIFLMLAILVWSCSRDDTNSIFESQVQTRQSVDYQIDNFDPPRNYESLRDCYNQFVKDGVETFNEKFGEDVSKRITYESEGNVSQVIPLFKGEVMENILWINEEYYFLLNISEERDSLDNPKRTYSRIFSLSKTEFLTGNTSLLDQNYLIENSENELRLTEIQKTVTPDEVYGKPYSPCSHWEDEWLLVYYDFFGLIPPNVGEPPFDVIEFETMNEIINSVTGGACVCPIPCLVIQALNEHPDVMQTAADLANRNWVMYEYGLDQFTVELMDSELLNEFVGYNCNPNSITDACSGNPIDQNTIINALLNSDLTLSGFHEAMDGVDYIIMPKSVEKACPKYFCIMNEMMNGNLGTSFVCSLLSGFDGTTGNNNGAGFHLHINTLDFSTQSGLNNAALAGTRAVELSQDDYRIQILINTLHCESTNVVEIFETIQHELIHADIQRRLIEVYGWDTSLSTEAEAFHQLVLQEYGGQAGEDEHRLMLEYYLDQMVDSLIEMNNGIGTYDDFVGAVLNGFPLDVLNYCGISLQDVQNSYDDFQNFISQSGNINQTLSGCE